MLEMKSKTKSVRYLLLFRVIFVRIWLITPKIFSSFILSYFRYGNSFISFGLRYLALQRLAISCGDKVVVFPGVHLKHVHNLEVGNNVSIHEMSYIDAYGGVKIGDNVAISHGVSIVSFDHDLSYNNLNFKDSPPLTGEIVIKENVWIGAGVRILKNVIIGKNSVLAASSLINKSCENNSIMAGIPAKCIKRINDHQRT